MRAIKLSYFIILTKANRVGVSMIAKRSILPQVLPPRYF